MDIAIPVKNLSKKYRLYDSPSRISDLLPVHYSPFTIHGSRLVKEALHQFRKKFHREMTVDESKALKTVGICSILF